MTKTILAPVLVHMTRISRTAMTRTMNIIRSAKQQMCPSNSTSPQAAAPATVAALAATSAPALRHSHHRSIKTSMCITKSQLKKSTTTSASTQRARRHRAPPAHRQCPYEGRSSLTLCPSIWHGLAVSFANCCDLAVIFVIYSRILKRKKNTKTENKKLIRGA